MDLNVVLHHRFEPSEAFDRFRMPLVNLGKHHFDNFKIEVYYCESVVKNSETVFFKIHLKKERSITGDLSMKVTSSKVVFCGSISLDGGGKCCSSDHLDNSSMESIKDTIEALIVEQAQSLLARQEDLFKI
ncbi:MAG: hypothetical protein AAB693_01915 [Patescibacteria group bacterium]